MTQFNFDTENSEKNPLYYSAVGKNKQKVEKTLFDLLDIATTVQKKVLTVLPTYHKSSVIDQQ